MTTTTTTHEVQLAVYDLSHGMARQLSAQFLGPAHAIEIIPHTAVVVFGQEYFFGGGIQHQDPQQFRQMMGIHPVQVLSLGQTTVTKADFDQWCQTCMQSGRYSMQSYDLLNHNCNNFSHDAAMEGLKLSKGVPDWILQVPRTFLSSPMGQMIRPMLENMQVGAAGGGGMAAPFANAPTSTFAAAPSPPPPMTNPWANMPSNTKTAATNPPKKETQNGKSASKGTPLLDSFCKPLLSSDSKTIPLCIKKITDNLQDSADKETLESIGKALTNNTNNQKLTSDQVQQACQIIHSKILQPNNKAITFALMLLRVILLQSTGQETAAQACLEWITTQITGLSSHAARAMAWLSLSNAVSLSWWAAPQDGILEAAIGDFNVESQPRQEVRQAAAAFCYNWVLQSSFSDNAELSDDQVSLLCASLESIASEPDATTKLRRVLVAARILMPLEQQVSVPAKTLMRDLGFPEAIQEVAQTTADTTGDAQKCQTLAREMLNILGG
ncbi:Desumoylating isopeptidase [Seminavis robusta]|uniref:Desumoylating isopeptidase n=1 Tax=Seminavis robusta TaxID=568900 RepID=A0A9N8EWS9_9STRA|nr:Desumoylating isopeptidase [Seminavis robusta]|eukprot:Sro2255_g320970.1 Desumoylating isopeptidase (497) ;mRNA; f:6525-8015